MRRWSPPSSISSTRGGFVCAARSRVRASISAPTSRAGRPREGGGVMRSAIAGKRMFVSGQLVEYWENPELPFGWTEADLQDYVDRGAWVLLFTAVLLPAPRPATPASRGGRSWASLLTTAGSLPS